MVNGTLASKNDSIYNELAKITHKSADAERLAAGRHFTKNGHIKDLSADEHRDEGDADDICTPFGEISAPELSFEIDITGQNLFYDEQKQQIKHQSEYSGQVIKLTYKASKLPCCWSYGRIFRSQGEIKLHAVCLSPSCDAYKVAYTENDQSKLKILLYNYDGEAQHTKRKYVTQDEKKKLPLSSKSSVRWSLMPNWPMSIFLLIMHMLHTCHLEAHCDSENINKR